MMSKSLTAAILAATLYVAALPAAHAGGGMGTPDAGVTTCRLVLNGSQNQPQTVSVVDGFVNGDVMKVNALVLICDLQAIGATQNTAQGVPSTGAPILPALRNAVACYTVTGADTARVLATVRDPFTEVNAAGGAEHVALGQIQLLCLPANMTTP